METTATLSVHPVPPRWRIGVALTSLYLVWGSTYFAIGQAVHTLPPFLMSSARFVAAGTLLYAWRRRAGAPRPKPEHWRSAAIISLFLILGGNGFVAWAEQRVPSGLAALIISITPVMIVLIDWWRPRGPVPAPPVVAGLVVGLAGMVILVGPARLEAAKNADGFSTFVCVLAPVLWASGSIYSRQARQTPDLLLGAGMQMLIGSAWLLGASMLTGELVHISIAAVTSTSVIAWAYLTVVGSIVGYCSYLYLLRHTTPAIATTYAYVNPIIAVLLGWLAGGEVVTGRILFAATMLIGGVVLITAFKSRR